MYVYSLRQTDHADIVKQYLVYCGWLIIELVFVVTYIVETRGRTLEETAALFDGEQSPQDLAQMGGEAATMTMGRMTGMQERPSKEKDRPVERDFLEMHDVSIHGSSTDEISAEMMIEAMDVRNNRRLYRIGGNSSL